MPIIKKTDYQRPKWLFNGHLQTIVPAFFRSISLLPFERERVNTPDGDFLDLDWLKSGADKVVIISHGLEGNSQRPYMLGMASQFFNKGYDVLNWNFRGCSGEMNKKPIFYHSGATYDLDFVVQHVSKSYSEVYLIGFSLGGNLTLKYSGEGWDSLEKVKKAVAISVPLHLETSSKKISNRQNFIYSNRFLKTLKLKILEKAAVFPKDIAAYKIKSVRTLQDFDDIYTGPLHGFDDAHDYYTKNSSVFFLPEIKIPALILNAQNDPFLSDKCFPISLGRQLENIYMEFPKYGGHVGFSPRLKEDIYWSEKRAFEFINGDE
jgi:uncharacterized protein